MTRASKGELASKSLLASFAVVEDAEIENCDLLAVLDVPFCMDSVSIDVLVPAFLGIVVAGVINAACIKKYPRFPHTVSKGEGVRSDDSQVPRGSIVGMNVMHREEASSLVRSERVDLFAYRCSQGLYVRNSFGHSDDGLFREDARTHRDHSCGDESFTLPWELPKCVH